MLTRHYGLLAALLLAAFATACTTTRPSFMSDTTHQEHATPSRMASEHHVNL